jgi:putative acetyltransferase
MHIRAEATADIAAIRSLLGTAFGRRQEADLVETLREAGDLALSLVADEAGGIVGHIAFSRLRSPASALALAPLAVSGACRRSGIGSALVLRGLEEAANLGARSVFVVGDPAYYERFGFSSQAAAAYPSAYSGAHFMVHMLRGGPQQPEPVIYADAFTGLA